MKPKRAIKPVRTEIHFVDSPEFYEPNADARLLIEIPHRRMTSDAYDPEVGRLLTEADLLTATEQVECSRMMNYLKFKASRTNNRKEAKDLLKRSEEVRNLLILSSLRLVVWVAAKFRRRLRPSQDYQDLFAAGVTALQRSVDLWNFRAGYNFSTYATTAIQRCCVRWMQREHYYSKLTVQFSEGRSDRDELLIGQVPARKEPDGFNIEADQVQVKKLVRKLPGRERIFIEQFFGLTGQRKSADEIGSLFNLTDSRVYQIIRAGLKSLRQSLAGNLPTDSPEFAMLQRNHGKQIAEAESHCTPSVSN